MSKLATFNIDESLWEEFKQWAKSKGSNASSELIGYIKTCLGYIDSNIDRNLDEVIDRVIKEKVFEYLDLYLDAHLDKRKELNIDKNIDENIDTQPKPFPKPETGNANQLTLEDALAELEKIKASLAASGVRKTNKEIAERLNLTGFPSPIEGKPWTAGAIGKWMSGKLSC